MLNKKISLPAVVVITLIAMLGSFLVASSLSKRSPQLPELAESVSVNNNCNLSLVRLSGYQYIRPILFGESECEAQELQPLKTAIEEVIRNRRNVGDIASASVYVREILTSRWVSAGDEERYRPGSLLKVPELITFMKMNEKNPGLLDKKLDYPRAFVLPKQAIFVSRTIEPGKKYSIRELLFYMIAFSDNNATMLLNQNMDLAVFKKVFTDLGLADPDMTKNDIPVSAKEYSLFMRVLFNATYLNIDDSEFCTELLTHSDFKRGLVQGLPEGLKVAHKFGEANDGTFEHFSESGIVYVNGKAYLLTVMTKGKDYAKLPSVVGDISRKVFEFMNRS